MKEYICIDIGGTSIKHGVVREDGTFAVTGEMPTQAMDCLLYTSDAADEL